MNIAMIIRAWKNSSYFHSLSEAERQQVPANPVESLDSVLELTDEWLGYIDGGAAGPQNNSNDCNPSVFSCSLLICKTLQFDGC